MAPDAPRQRACHERARRFKQGVERDLIRPALACDAGTIARLRDAAILAGCKGHYPGDLLALDAPTPVSARFVQDVCAHFHV